MLSGVITHVLKFILCLTAQNTTAPNPARVVVEEASKLKRNLGLGRYGDGRHDVLVSDVHRQP
jgi:hypothetical protein